MNRAVGRYSRAMHSHRALFAGAKRTELLLVEPPCLPSADRILARMASSVAARCDSMGNRVESLLPDMHRTLSMRSIGRIMEIGSCKEMGREDLPKPIRRADAMGVGIGTVGSGITALAAELRAKGRWIDAWICDTSGIVALDDLCNRLTSTIRNLASDAGCDSSSAHVLGTTSESWDLSFQRLIFDWLPANEMGVTLNPDSLMIPVSCRMLIVGISESVRGTSSVFGRWNCDFGPCSHPCPGDARRPQREKSDWGGDIDERTAGLD